MCKIAFSEKKKWLLLENLSYKLDSFNWNSDIFWKGQIFRKKYHRTIEVLERKICGKKGLNIPAHNSFMSKRRRGFFEQ